MPGKQNNVKTNENLARGEITREQYGCIKKACCQISPGGIYLTTALIQACQYFFKVESHASHFLGHLP